MTATGRQCVLATLEHTEPERLPVDLGGRHATMHIHAHQALKAFLGLDGGEETFRQFWLQTVEIDPRISDILGGDVVSFCTSPPDSWQMSLDEARNEFTDEWGATYRMPPGGYYYDYRQHPLAEVRTLAQLDNYPWPDPLDPGRFRGLREKVEKAHLRGDRAIQMSISPAGSWEHTWTLRGPQQALLDLVLERELYEAILDRTVSFQLRQWGRVLDLVGDWIDVVAFSDDLGTQVGPMMSPRLYRELFKPRLMKLTALIHSRSHAKVYIHTDGSVYAFLPDLIEAGIEIINPVQTECKDMSAEKLKKEFGRNLTFWGAGCRTRTMEFGAPEEVRQEAIHAIGSLAPGGGYVFAAVHNIQPEVPPKNVATLFQTARQFGRYPIRIAV